MTARPSHASPVASRHAADHSLLTHTGMSVLNRSSVLLLASMALAGTVPAQSASFTYSTRGCIASSGATCTPTGADPLAFGYLDNVVRGGIVRFTGVDGVTVGPTNSSGYVALSNLGTFTFQGFNSGDGFGVYLPNLTFNLWIDFTVPSVTGDPVIATATLNGWVPSSSAMLSVDFTPESYGGLSYATEGGSQSVRFFVNDASIGSLGGDDEGGFYVIGGSSLTLSGALDCSWGSNTVNNQTTYVATPTSGGPCAAPSTPGANIQSTVPEPSTYALMAAGLAGLGMAARRRRRNA